MDETVLDLYTDYLTTATCLSSLLGDTLSHDHIGRFLTAEDFLSADLRLLVKPLVRQIQRDEAVLILDDSIEAKPYTE